MILFIVDVLIVNVLVCCCIISGHYGLILGEFTVFRIRFAIVDVFIIDVNIWQDAQVAGIRYDWLRLW